MKRSIPMPWPAHRPPETGSNFKPFIKQQLTESSPSPLNEDDACLHVGNLGEASGVQVEVVPGALAVVVVRTAE
jgi:hypothetical protein